MCKIGRWIFVFTTLAYSQQSDPAALYYRIESQRGTSPSQALAAAEQAYTLFRSYNSTWSWRFRLLLADISIQESKLGRAEQLLRETPEDSEARRRLVAARAYLMYRQKKSKPKPAAELAVEPIPDDPCWTAEVLAHKAMAIITLGTKVQEALSPINSAKTYADKCGTPYWAWQLELQRARLFETQHRYEQQAAVLKAVLAAANQYHLPRLIRNASGNLALAYYSLGDFTGALEILKNAEQLYPRPEDRHELAIDIGHRGRVQESLGHHSEALGDYQRAIEMTEGIWRARFLDELTTVYLQLDQPNQAERINRSVLETVEQEIGDAERKRVIATARVNAALILRVRGKFKEALAGFRRVSTSDADVVWRLQSERAQTYAAAGHNSLAERDFEASLRTAKGVRNTLSNSWSRMTFFGHLKNLYGAYIDFLMDRHETQRALQLAEESRALTLAELLHREPDANPHRLADIARSHKAVILSYWIGNKHSYVWVTKPTGSQAFELDPLPTVQTDIENYVQTLHDQQNPLLQPRRARDLFKQLVAPAMSAIPPNSNLILVPDGKLAELNFETLIPPGPAHFWIDDIVSLTVAPSLALMEAQRPLDPKANLLFIGNPKIVSSEKEWKAIKSSFSGNLVKLLAATPASVREAHPEYFSILHVSAHAEARKESPLDSSIRLEPDKTGADRFYAHDFMPMKLHAQLVTLSACEAAGGRSVEGEGLVGLTWAILSAGARNVVAPLGKISDEYSPVLINEFYRNLNKGADPAHALATAKRAEMRINPTPYHWAAFQLYSR